MKSTERVLANIIRLFIFTDELNTLTFIEILRGGSLTESEKSKVLEDLRGGESPTTTTDDQTTTLTTTSGDQATTTSTRCQYHQHFTSSSFVWKCFVQLLYAYSLGL